MIMSMPIHRRRLGALAAALLLSAASGTWAQPADSRAACGVAGVVRDTGGLAIPGVVVSLASTGLSDVTDGDGAYCLPRLRPGPYAVDVVLSGFAPERVDVVVGDDGPAVADVVLVPGGFREETVVTATRTRQGLDRVPVRTELVRRADIEASSARTLADAMEFTTGVRVENNCQTCNFSQVRLLGLDGPYTQILFDGQPTFSSLASVYGLEQVPAGQIERIEVVKGGGSALYGAGAVGGVINVISREATRTRAGAELRVESMQGLPAVRGNGSLDWTARDRQTAVTAFAQADGVRPVDVNGDGFTEVARRQLEAGGVRVNRYALQGRGKLTGDLSLLREDRRGGNLLRRPPQEADIAEALETTRVAGSLGWYHSASAGWDYRGSVSVADTHRDSYYGVGRDPNAFGDTASRLTVADVQSNRYLSRHVLTAGLMASRESLEDVQPAYGRALDLSYTSVGLYLQDDWTIGARTQVLLGTRVDRHSAVGRAIASPRAAVRWSPRTDADVRVSVARGFRAPEVFDEDLHLTSVGGQVVQVRQSPDLREERSTNVLAGAEWKPLVWGGQALVEVNTFSTRLHDQFLTIVDRTAPADALAFLKVNLGDAHVYGTEVNLGWGMGEQVVAQGGFVVQRATRTVADPDFGSRRAFRTPEVYGNLSLTWMATPATRLFLGMRYTGPMLVPHRRGVIHADRLERTPRFVTLDASVSRRLRVSDGRSVELQIGARNLTNAYQRDMDVGPTRDSDYVYGPRFPRALTASLRVGL